MKTESAPPLAQKKGAQSSEDEFKADDLDSSTMETPLWLGSSPLPANMDQRPLSSLHKKVGEKPTKKRNATPPGPLSSAAPLRDQAPGAIPERPPEQSAPEPDSEDEDADEFAQFWSPLQREAMLREEGDEPQSIRSIPVPLDSDSPILASDAMRSIPVALDSDSASLASDAMRSIPIPLDSDSQARSPVSNPELELEDAARASRSDSDTQKMPAAWQLKETRRPPSRQQEEQTPAVKTKRSNTPSRAPALLGLGLILAFLAQALVGQPLAGLSALQAIDSYKIATGTLLLLYLGHQWRLPLLRMAGRAKKAKTAAPLHRWIGALGPLFYFLHSSRLGHSYLLVLSSLFFSNAALALIGDGIPKLRRGGLGRVWLTGHIALSMALLPLAALHIWIAFYYE